MLNLSDQPVDRRAAVVSFFESSSVHFRRNEDLEESECSNYYCSIGHSISLVVKLLNQQSAQLNKVKEHCLRSICEQQLYCSLRAHQSNSDQMKSLKYQSAQTTIRAVGIAYFLWPHFPVNRVLNFAKLRSII